MNTPLELHTLTQYLLQTYMDQKHTVIAIDGAGASGKSTLSERLCSHLPECSIIHFDDFYIPRTDPEVIASHFDYHRLIEQVFTPLFNSKPVKYQLYEWQTDTMLEWKNLDADRFIILEGVSSCRIELLPFIDVRIYIDAPYELRLQRGLERDGEDARNTWIYNWMPREELYLKSHHAPRDKAHIILDGSYPLKDNTIEIIHSTLSF